VVLVACGGPSAEEVVERASTSLADVRSGELVLRVRTGALEGEAGDVGFEVTGPFAAGAGEPRAQLTYRQHVADTEQVTVVTAIGDRAYVEVEGRAYALDDPPPPLAAGALETVDLGTWLLDPEVVEEDGDTRRIEARLDAPLVLRGLVALAAGAEAGEVLGELADADAETIRRAARTATATLEVVGAEGYLRRLHGRIELVTDVAEAVGAGGARIEFELGLDAHNEPVAISAPASPLPQADLPTAGGT
jgi:hypothetical protein